MNIPTADSVEQVGVIPTGLPQVDRILGIGGIPFGRITEISGVWSSGKTSFVFGLIRSAQEQGIKCIYVECEWTFEAQYARELGVNLKKLLFIQNRVAEDSLNTLLEYVEKGKDTLIVIDAVGALHSRDEAQKDAEQRTIGAQSSLIARFCRKIVPMLSLNNNALVVLNHEYTPIEANGGRPQVKTSGGKKLEYHKSIWLRLKKTGNNLKQGSRSDGSPNYIGFEVEFEVMKNKMAGTQKQKAVVNFFFNKGFSGEADLLADAIAKGVIVKDGGNYMYLSEKIAYGEPKARKWLEEHLEEIKDALAT